MCRFNNNCFNGIDLKTKPFCDVLFSSQFTPMLNADPQDAVPADNNMMVTKDLVDSPPPQLMQHATDLRLQFPSDDETALRTHDAPPPPPPPLHQAPPPPAQSLSNNMDLIQPQHIKIEATPDIPTFHSEDTLVANEVEVEEEDDYDYDDDGRQSEEYNTQTIDINNERFLITNYSPKNGDLDLTNQNENDDDENENAVDDTGKRKRYLCNKCQRVFNSCNALKYHMRTHSGLRPHQCDICGKSFFAHGALKAHTRTHTGDKPFECEHCDRKFRQWGDLKYHIVSIHSSEKNHQCEYCGKSFSRKYSLVVHLRIHTSERNYKCEFCTKTFRASTYLQNHRKIHTGEKNHECDVCSKRFRVSGDLRRHQRIHERAQKSKKDTLEEKTTTGVKTSVASTPTT